MIHDLSPQRSTQKVIYLPHPDRISAGEIIVDGDNMHAGDRTKHLNRPAKWHQSFSFPRAHLGNSAFIQNHSANQLNVKVTLAKSSSGSFSHYSKSFPVKFPPKWRTKRGFFHLIKPRFVRLLAFSGIQQFWPSNPHPTRP